MIDLDDYSKAIKIIKEEHEQLLKAENDRDILYEIINKTIKYIEECNQATLQNDCDGIGFEQKIDLLNILKGE